MAASKHIDKICCAVMAFVLVLTVVFVNAEKFGVTVSAVQFGYEQKLFDTSKVHTIDIVMDDWDGFLDTCEKEEYEMCSLVIDNEAYKNAGIRAKGNTSLSMVSGYGNDRYSFKIEFDHYDSAGNYYGLDKLCLNNMIQDNTYMKDFLVYQMMRFFGVDAPLCSYVYLTVNGEDWGLYLAVEGIEESFLERSYGSNYGELYKPDSMTMGGGRGNGRGFDMDGFEKKRQGTEASEKLETINTSEETKASEKSEESELNGAKPDGEAPNQDLPLKEKMPPGEDLEKPEGLPGGDLEKPQEQRVVDQGEPPKEERNGGRMGSRGSDDVSLIYMDDDYDSYANIFENAKTDISDTDKDRLIKSLKKMNDVTDIESAVNTEEVIRYFVVHNFVCNFDSYTGSMIHNYYLYEENGQMYMIPWDYNLAFGGFQSQSDAEALINYPVDTPVSGGDTDSRPMLAWILNNEKYTEQYHAFFSQFITDYFESGYFDEMTDCITEMIAPYVEKDPTKFCTYEQFQTGAAVLKQFCSLRAESICGQLDGTIPSTEEGQKQDQSSLIDGKGLVVSDMGSMHIGSMDMDMRDRGKIK